MWFYFAGIIIAAIVAFVAVIFFVKGKDKVGFTLLLVDACFILLWYGASTYILAKMVNFNVEAW